MGILDIFRTRPQDNQPRIRNAKELMAFMLNATKDQRLATFLVEVAEKVGWPAYPVVERGGNGTPYSLECQGGTLDSRPVSEVQAEMATLKQSYALATTDDERDRIDRQIATLAWGHCIIHINVMTSDEFNRQRTLILNTWANFKNIVRKNA